jgi:hypothetical protein
MQAFILASGPSLTREDCDLIKSWAGGDRIVIAVNLSWRMAPWANVLFAGDAAFYSHDPYRLEVQDNFRGTLYTASQKAARIYGLNLLNAPLLTNSGANAIQLARQLGADWIGLLGFDYGPADDGALHWHEDHQPPLGNSRLFETPEIQRLARELREEGIKVVNCSRRTRLDCFTRMDLEHVI